MSTLYRKYRPQLFADIHDQIHIVKTITNEIISGKIAHAYLFTGPRGVGKTTIARLLAKAINCKNRKEGAFEPCNECSSCTEISLSRNIDVIEIDAASHTGVDNVRENIIENAQFKPTQSAFKIFIIDEVHMLSSSAFNALLKTIEEPPAHVVFILATTELQKLPATIISRCQRFAFKKITREAMLDKLQKICKDENVKVEKSVLEKIISKSEGGMRDAESLLGQILSSNLKEITEQDIASFLPSSDFNSVISFLDLIVAGNAQKAIEQINNLVTNGLNLDQFILDLIEILRASLIAKTGYDVKEILNTEKETLQKIKDLSQNISSPKIIEMIDSILIRKREIKQSPIPQLPLELFAVQFSDTQPLSFRPNEVCGGIPSTPKNPPANEEKKTPEAEKPSEKPQKTETFTSTIKTAISNLTHNQAPKSTLEDVQIKWTQFVGTITPTLPSLTFILKMCELERIDEQGLHLKLQFKIHLDKIEESKNKKILEDSLEKIIGERIKINSRVVSAEEPAKNDVELTNLAAEFGGELV